MLSRTTSFESIDTSRAWHASGCHAYSLYNGGNVNVTINKVLVLTPGMCWEGANENPDVVDNSSIDVEFDMTTPPDIFAPVGGIVPPGQTNPVRDTRLIIFKSIITGTK